MKAMILAAGRGERLRPLTDRTPKPLVAVAGRPLLLHQLGWLAAAGIQDVVINLRHLGEQIVAVAGDGSDHGVRIRYSRETAPLETGGGIVQALPLLGDEPFLIVNGDIYTDLPFADLPTAPPPGCLAHLVVTPRPPVRAEGDFDVHDGRVTARGDTYVYCGIALLHPTALAGRRAEPFSLRDVFFALLAEGRLSAQVWHGRWTDIGTLDQLESLNEALGG